MTGLKGLSRSQRLLGAVAGIIAVTVAAVYAAVLTTGDVLPVGSKVSPYTLIVYSSASLPPEVQAQEAASAPNLFDRDISTQHVAFAESQVEAAFETTEEVRAVKVYGAAPYLLTVKAEAGGSYQTIAGLENLNLTLLPSGWTAFNAVAPATTGKLMFVLTPASGGSASGLRELEVWTGRTPISVKSGAALLDKMLSPSPLSQGRIYTALNPTANPTVGVIVPSGDDTSDNIFSFTLDRDPIHFVRAYLVYELNGQEHWISPLRKINTSGPAGGVPLLPSTSSSIQVERINPAWLKKGSNTIEFGVLSSSFKEAGYTVRNVRMLGELDNGANAIETVSANQPDAVSTNPVEALYDGDLATGWKPYPPDQPINAASPSVEFEFRKPTQMDALSFYLSAPLDGELQVSVKRAGQWIDYPPEQGSVLSTGWNTIPVRSETPLAERVLDGVKLTFLGGFSSTAEIREFLFVGSGVDTRTGNPRFVITYPNDGQFHGRKAYLRGFLQPLDNGSGNAQISFAGVLIGHIAGQLTQSITKDTAGFASQADNDAWSVEVKAVYPNGETVTTIVALTRQMSQASAAEGTLAGTASGTFFNKRKATIAHDESKLIAEAGTVATDTTITVTPLAEESVPALDIGMTNVTKGPRRGYRFLPHGAKFLKNVTVTLPYDKALIPPGHTEDDIKTFYFDDQAGRWIALEGATVDKANKLVNSLTNHFTDMVNAVVTVPDHPQTVSFNPTSMKDIKAADPGAQVNLIEPPRVNNMGDARMSYPIEVPPGRQGLQPQLAVQYNSSGGNGWMGMGWDIPVRAITIDTRWGVPRYSPSLETETYLLDGEQLTPVAHRGELQPRSAEKVFHARVEGQFRKIIRHGSSPSTYWWEVTDKNGTRYFYGGTPENNGPVTDGVLADPAVESPAIGNIYKWVLKEVRDTNGNSLKYHCDVVESRAGEPWRQIYPRRVTYTGSVGVDGPYEVIFNREGGRTDVMVDGRPGFKTVMDQRLASIEVRLTTAANPLIRRYVFSYQTGAFRKTLLTKVTQYADDGTTEFNNHRFEYFDEVSTATANTLNSFGPLQSFGGASTVRGEGLVSSFSSTAFGGSATSNQQLHFYAGIAVGPAKEVSAGFKVGSDAGKTKTKLSLLDIDGDGLLDQVYQSGGQFSYRSNVGGPQSSAINFAAPVDFALPDLGRENSNTTTFGVQGFAIGINGLADLSMTRTRGEAYISDVNGDGLPDVVTGGAVSFNRLVNNKPVFDAASPTPLGSSAPANTSNMVTDPNEARAEIEAAYHLTDPLRRWVAPYAGTVAISGAVRLVTAPSADYLTADGVRVAIQHNSAEIWSTEITNPVDLSARPIVGLNAVSVQAGDRIYFRVNSRYDGSFDAVEFDPTITYTGFDATAKDENGQPVFAYNAASDYAYGGAALQLAAPANGQATLAGSFVKSGTTSDDVIVQIIQNGTVVATHTIAANQSASVPISQALTTVAGDRLLVRIHADSRVDLTKVRFAPSLTYTVIDGNPAPTDDNGIPAVVLFPPVTAQIYPQQAMTAYTPVIASQTGTLSVTMSTALPNALPSGYHADLTLTVKKQNALLAKQRVQIRNGAIVGPASLSADIAVTAGDALYFTAAGSTHDLPSFASVSASYAFGGAEPTPTPVDLHLAASPSEAFGGGYRRWSYGQYNGNNVPAPVNESLLRQPTSENDQVFRSFIGMIPFQNEDRFRVQDEETWITAARMSASRLGVNYLEFPDGSSFGGARGIVRYGGARNRAGSISVLGFGAGTASGDNWSDIDFMDLNGDRYPDILGGGSVQPTLPNGGLEGVQMSAGAFGRVRESHSETINVSLGASTQQLRTSSLGKLLGIYTEQAAYNLSAGVTGGRGEFAGKWDLVDINGDGLPDYVRPGAGGLAVRLNLGYRDSGGAINYHFGVEENWGGSGTLRFEKSVNKGVNAGFTTPAYSFGGGISHTISKTGAQQDLLDMNGDGLPDIVTKSVNDDAESDATAFTVRLNTGNGFTEEMTFNGAMPRPIRANASVSRNLGAHFTYTAACWPIPPICIVLNPGFYKGDSLGGFEVQVADFNGDGYPDHIYSDTNGNVEVRLNNHGRTNLLKKVYRPLGADFSLRYARSGNTQDQPQSRWVLSGVLTFDGHVGEGADFQASTFSYADGKYDRAERDFYGYRNVTEVHRDTAGITLGNAGAINLDGQPVYRRIARTFLTSSFYTKGLLETEAIFSTSNVKLRETINTYQVVDVAAGAAVAGLADFSATRFPQLTRTDKVFAEEGSTGQKLTYTTHEYDTLGNIVRFTDAGDDVATDDIDATIGYSNCASHVIKPNSITVKGNGTDMRRRESNIDCTTGDVSEVRQYLANGTAAFTNLTYFPNGNLRTVTGPANKTAQRYTLTYEYDPAVATHVTRISDSFGLSSQATHNYFFGKPETTTDTNGQQTTYFYDSVGRVEKIMGPYEQGQSTATLSFAYAPVATPTFDEATGATQATGTVPWALTKHVDKDVLGAYKSTGTIDTILFTDGLKRVLQTKKDATVLKAGMSAGSNDMIVSGRVVFDAFGRTTEQRYPVTETKHPDNATNVVYNGNATGNGVTPTVTAYDVLDRVIQTRLPDQTFTTIAYKLGVGRSGTGNSFETIVTDNNKTAGLNGAIKHTFRDVRDLITSVREDTLNGPIWTSYEYDALKQITKVTDDKNNVTTVAYDNFGRRGSINNPDTGLTTFVYDTASNLTQKITATLQAAGQAINYDYDFNRLVAVRYPTFTGNNISYTYGAPGALNNTAGRITKVVSKTTTNANGQTFQDSEERHYGKLGEVIFEKKTVVTFTSPNTPSVFETKYQFDTFGRLQKLTYPDGEILTNAYDSGGNLLATKGEKNNYRYDYLKRLNYDEFEQRVLMEQGNGVKTAYTYNAQTRRLDALTAGRSNGTLFQSLAYSYDKVGNVLNLKNTVDVPPANSYGGPTNQTFVYDELYRLTHADGTYQYSPNKTHTYNLDMGYDSIHNIQTKNQLHTLVQPSTQAITQKKTTYNWSYQYNASGPSSVRPHAPTHIGERTYTYDANGNQLGWTHDKNGTRRTIVWNEENRAEEISDNGHTKTYKYDDQGQRTIKRGPQGETVYVNQFYTQRPGATGTKHVYAGTGRIVSKLMKQDTPGANPLGKTPFEKDLYFYHPDHLGSSNYITDTNGKLYEHLEYFPFGEGWVEENSNTQRTPYLFTAKELDEETGLYYYGARYYDPRTSVWQSADPILEKYLPSFPKIEERLNAQRSMNADSARGHDITDHLPVLAMWNPEKELPAQGGVYRSSNLGLYTYAAQNPIKYSDPDGKISVPFYNDDIEKGIIANAPKYGVHIDKSVEKQVARAMRQELTWDEAKQLQTLEDKIQALPGEVKDGVKLLGPEAWKTRQSLVEKQKEIGQRVLNRVLKERLEWRDKIKVDKPSDSKPAESAPTSPAPTNPGEQER